MKDSVLLGSSLPRCLSRTAHVKWPFRHCRTRCSASDQGRMRVYIRILQDWRNVAKYQCKIYEHTITLEAGHRIMKGRQGGLRSYLQARFKEDWRLMQRKRELKRQGTSHLGTAKERGRRRMIRQISYQILGMGKTTTSMLIMVAIFSCCSPWGKERRAKERRAKEGKKGQYNRHSIKSWEQARVQQTDYDIYLCPHANSEL